MIILVILSVLLLFLCVLLLMCILLLYITGSKDQILYYENFWRPYKSIQNKKIKKIMVGMPTIDRDADIAEKIYINLLESINMLKNKHDVDVDLVVITRKTDKKIIKFWENKVNHIILVDSYSIKKRHNLSKLSEKFNKLAELSRNYDVLFIVESDIVVHPTTATILYEKLNNYHIVTTSHEIPWCKYPIFIKGGLFPSKQNARDINKDITILGHGTGAIMIRTEVFDHCDFTFGKFFNIEGQDIGFYIKAFKNRYKVCLVNQEVTHLYNR